jgi:CRP/FNR family transcriptional regulator, cyclic AMP receptor protein
MRRTSKARKVELLRGVSLFSQCSTRELSQIAAITTQVEIPAGKVLARHDDLGFEMYVIVEGRARVDLPGARQRTLGPGAFFGEMSLLDGGPRSATVTTTTPMSALVLSRAEFASLLHSAPSVARKMLAELAGRLRVADTAAARARQDAITR